MRKLDQRGVGAMEFCLVALPLFILMFTIFDLGRYAITMQSLRALANAGARTWMINDCYVSSAISKTTPTCAGDPLPSAAAKQAVAPMIGGLSPTLSTTAGANVLTVTASVSSFNMIMPIWGTALNAPSASTIIPF
ncbi:TadE/TadG family type IV pilus assembly protein [Bradyrhizobium sp. 30]|uniref:TadE family protein n=1 Tax=Bradyrhizobium sp. 30 TaxID=2782669 RepID=UPI001FF866C7|nr:TadE/TadG family type IV pilus assembly protein [Bradyrhizobium sp. 30]